MPLCTASVTRKLYGRKTPRKEKKLARARRKTGSSPSGPKRSDIRNREGVWVSLDRTVNMAMMSSPKYMNAITRIVHPNPILSMRIGIIALSGREHCFCLVSDREKERERERERERAAYVPTRPPTEEPDETMPKARALRRRKKVPTELLLAQNSALAPIALHTACERKI